MHPPHLFAPPHPAYRSRRDFLARARAVFRSPSDEAPVHLPPPQPVQPPSGSVVTITSFSSASSSTTSLGRCGVPYTMAMVAATGTPTSVARRIAPWMSLSLTLTFARSR